MGYKKIKKRKELKEQIIKLQKELHIVCNNPDSAEASLIRHKWTFIKDLEDAVFNGSPTKPELYNQV